MGWLLKRGVPLARQGWRDDFDRADENPVQPPWRQWGDPVGAQLVGGKLRLAATTYSFPNWANGGWGPEYQPLTKHWGYEFRATLPGRTHPGFGVYLDKNWTRGQYQSSSQFQTYIIWSYGTDESGNESFQVFIQHKNANAWGAAQKAYVLLSTDQGTTEGLWRIDVLYDKVIIVTKDGAAVLLYTIDDANYYFTPDRRGLNFKQDQAALDVDSFFVFDRRDIPPTWTANQFGDSFDRANGAVGNGWTALGSSPQIVNNSFSMQGGFPSDGGRAVIRSLGITNGRLGILGVTGGNANPTGHEQGLILLANAAGTQGLMARCTSAGVKICTFSNVTDSNPSAFAVVGVWKNAIGGIGGAQWVYFEIFDNTAYVWRGEELLAYLPNVSAYAPLTNQYMGPQVSRYALANSGSWDSVQCYQIN